MLCVWTEQGVASRWVRTEAAEGAARDILVPVLMEDVRIPLAFRRIQAADLTDWEEGQEHEGFNELLAALEDVISRAEREPPEPEDPVERAVSAAQARAAEKDWEAVIALLEPVAAENADFDEQNREAAEMLALARDKRDAAELYEEAEVLYSSGRWQEVVARFGRILELDPDFEYGTELRARAERHIEAERERRLANDYQRAVDALEVREWAVAIARFEQLLEDAPDYGEAAAKLEQARAAADFERQYRDVRDAFHREQWEDVVAAMSELAVASPGFGDPDDLLPKARARIAQAERRAAERRREVPPEEFANEDVDAGEPSKDEADSAVSPEQSSDLGEAPEKPAEGEAAERTRPDRPSPRPALAGRDSGRSHPHCRDRRSCRERRGRWRRRRAKSDPHELGG